MTSTLPAEFRQPATSRPATLHQSLMVGSFPHGGAGADHSHNISATYSSIARSYRKQLHVVIMFLITTLGGYVQVEYQSKRKSPFDAHAAIMAAILVILCLYAASFIAEFQLDSEKPYVAVIKKFGPLLGFMAIMLLLIILNPLLGIIASIIWVFFVLEAAFTSYLVVRQCLCEVFSVIRLYLVSETSHPQDEHENASPGQSQAEDNV